MDTLTELSNVLKARRDASPDSSYVASLYHGGLNKILEKVGEEATEVILASRDLAQGERGPQAAELTAALTSEVADLWFHTMVMLTHHNVEPQQVLDVLAARFGVSGITEKRNR